MAITFKKLRHLCTAVPFRLRSLHGSSKSALIVSSKRAFDVTYDLTTCMATCTCIFCWNELTAALKLVQQQPVIERAVVKFILRAHSLTESLFGLSTVSALVIVLSLIFPHALSECGAHAHSRQGKCLHCM